MYWMLGPDAGLRGYSGDTRFWSDDSLCVRSRLDQTQVLHKWFEIFIREKQRGLWLYKMTQ